mgnify:CR=1 FL=1
MGCGSLQSGTKNFIVTLIKANIIVSASNDDVVQYHSFSVILSTTSLEALTNFPLLNTNTQDFFQIGYIDLLYPILSNKTLFNYTLMNL